MQLSCKACRKPIPADDVNLDQGIAKCRACHAVFGFLDQVAGGARGLSKPEVGLPQRFRVDNWGPELKIEWPWYNHGVWFLLVFCLFWDGFLVVWYTAGFGMLANQKFEWGLALMLLFPILHLAVGVGLSYLVLCTFFNRTTIRVAAGELTIRHGPLPVGFNRQLIAADVRQLYCTETTRRTKHGYRTSYNLVAALRNERTVPLLQNLEQYEQARFVEQEVEKHLKIADEPVAGELRA